VTAHYHAYAYTGKGYSDNQVRARASRDPDVLRKAAPPNYPPLTTGDPGEMQQVARPGSLEEAVDWLKGELTAHDPLGSESFPVEDRLAYSRAQLQQTAANIVVYGYWSRSGQYVARRIYPCTTPACRR
jgi:hypothetical protein